VWPDFAEDSGTVMAGYFVAAALAGLSSGVLPHQGLTNVEVGGLTALPRTSRFNRTQLNSMAVQGAWIVAQDPISGDIFTAHVDDNGITKPLFSPMDPITIYLQRVRGRPVRVFTGFLDRTPYLQLYPGVIQLKASCTLKRLLYTYFDPALPYTQTFLKNPFSNASECRSNTRTLRSKFIENI
jgi:hypothetical protein